MHRYSVYGITCTMPSPKSLLGFNGEHIDQKNMYILGSYRSYSTTLMRFHSPDKFSPFAQGGLSTYAYCAGDPVNYSDPTGHGKFSSLFSGLFSRSKQHQPPARHTHYQKITVDEPGDPLGTFNIPSIDDILPSITQYLPIDDLTQFAYTSKSMYGKIIRPSDTLAAKAITTSNLLEYSDPFDNVELGQRLPGVLRSSMSNRLKAVREIALTESKITFENIEANMIRKGLNTYGRDGRRYAIFYRKGRAPS